MTKRTACIDDRLYDYISRTSLGEHTGEILVNEALKFVSENPRPAPLTAK